MAHTAASATPLATPEAPALSTNLGLRLLPWLLLAGTIAAATASVVLYAAGEANSDSTISVMAVVPAAVGALIASRVPRHPIGWLLLTVGFVLAIEGLAEGYMDAHLDQPEEPLVIAASWISAVLWTIPVSLGGILLPLLFPDGRPLSPPWRHVVRLQALALLLTVVFAAFMPGEMDAESGAINPIGVGLPDIIFEVATELGNAFMAFGFLAAGVSQVLRFRRSRGEEREQLKWFAFMAALIVVGILVAFATLIIGENGVTYVVGAAGWFTALIGLAVGLPVAVGIAVLRYRLYDIDWIINRTMVYVPLSALLAGVYIAVTGIFKTLLSDSTGAGSDAAVAATTVVVVTLLTPAKNYLQERVDRHFKNNNDSMRELERLAKEARAAAEIANPGLFVQRFLDSSAKALEARGASVRLDDGRVFTYGESEAEPVLKLPIAWDGRELGQLEVCVRANGRAYTAMEREALQKSVDEVACLIAAATMGAEAPVVVTYS